MPFTPIHMGPGIAVKAILQGSFSLMVFGWSQIVMDVQPLWVMMNGHGHIHGFSHTFIGALLLAIFSALTGKYLAQIGLRILRIAKQGESISWTVTLISSLIGTYSHVLLDGIMHWDVQPFAPFDLHNPFLAWLSIEALHKLCLYSGLVGAVIYFGVRHTISKQTNNNASDKP